ncbi:type II toxin-antitoxin system VapC family toxin [Sphaerospermopsis sp. LEGE 08334]|jgi:tRNA(fMet)-specific endonuclease VapC|uniref:type II toxin-antitoxin system VapC family toxin n=1 Tax=Sphaerospermopsis sp. LEGE 08334 TaxID=1828651 RepID=UPI001882B7FE|nr:type II toxin-antitoxin system VapC family toxin [Sphaerospermopsis sp. LEGE 08334]MBE9055909.1 type II toxin-antitoxin system VapC family toxin [Sphaerospermopsis sp. LEGE 08334]
MYLLDTNHCSFLIEGEPKVVNHFRQIGKAIIATNAVVVGELRFMAQNSQQKTANLLKIQAFLQRIDVYKKIKRAKTTPDKVSELDIVTPPQLATK